MKPSFALDLRSSVITLLHRTASGWTNVGEASLYASDLNETLALMRATALGLSPRGITTKVILPNTQILYTSLTPPKTEPWARPGLIAAALEGLTPYALDELAFDWCEGELGLQIAVVAKETLDQAETFASRHRFNPVSFVAVPEGAVFVGEPFFGPSRLSQSILAKDETVERDSEAVRVLDRQEQAHFGGPELPAAAAVDAAPFTPAQPTLASHDGAPTLDAQPSAPSPAEEPIAPDEPTPIAADAVNPDQGVLPPNTPSKALADQAAVVPIAEPVPAPNTLADLSQPPPSEVPEAPMALDVDSDSTPTDADDADKPFAQVPSGDASSTAKSAPPHDDRLRATGPALRAPVPRPNVAVPLPTPVRKPVAARPWQGATAKGSGRDAAKLDKTRATLDRVANQAAQSAAQQRRYIIFILTAVLVTLLAMVAIWSAISLSTNDAKNRTSGPTIVVAQSATPAVEPIPSPPSGTDPAATESNDPSQTAATPVPSTLDEATSDGQAPDAASPDPPQTAALDPAPATDVSADVVAATQDTAGQDEIFLASADTPPVSLDPIALPALQDVDDSAPIPPSDPPPYTAPEPDPLPSDQALAQAQSLILAPPVVPVGALPMQEVVVSDPTLADKPPHPRPADLVAVLAAPDASDNLAADSLAPDSSYAKLPPQPRPADLTPDPQANDAQAESLVLTSSPKPQPRPADIGTGANEGIDDAVAVALNPDATTDQPKAEAPAPSLPTNASVAKQATDRNVLKANGVVLLAVFGTPSSRYAMMRLGNGRIKKVQLGDTFDGGRIAGITADTVQYQKGSRVITLSLPQG